MPVARSSELPEEPPLPTLPVRHWKVLRSRCSDLLKSMESDSGKEIEGTSCRWWCGRKQCADAVPGRYFWQRCDPSESIGNHCAWSGLPGRVGSRVLEKCRRDQETMGGRKESSSLRWKKIKRKSCCITGKKRVERTMKLVGRIAKRTP
jgi:hypothetical protein